jgi:hypothetical protein
VGLHPCGKGVLVKTLGLIEKLEPTLLLGFDRFGGEFTEFQQPDTAVVQEDASVLIAQPEVVCIIRVIRQQGLTQQPDGIGGAQLAVTFARLDLRAVEVGPAVENGSAGRGWTLPPAGP